MNPRYFNILASISALVSGSIMLSPASASAQQERVEELTRGPVHEAFASSVSYNPEPGIFTNGSPPEMIEEIPPDQRPEGDNVSWIPGYWAWDGDQDDFIWISGIWRKLPPGRQWNPGYWGQVDDRSQWTSGYWADEGTQEVAYLPRPPKSLETGPNIAAQSDNDIWISGNWTHREDRYGWTPGYWEPAQQDWIWIPAHYQWTRRGYVFIDGYWDYNVSRRGVMFAPVRFHGDGYRRPGYSYTPLLAISLNVFLDHLFVRPTYGHYYFGDYYSNGYRDNGYFASHSYYSGRGGYDPIYSHNRWDHRDDSDWERSRISDFNFYRDNEESRPAHTWADVQNRPNNAKDRRDNYAIAQPLSVYAKQADSGQRFQAVSEESRDGYVEQRKEIRDFTQNRRQIESRPVDKSDKDDQVSREKLEKSPLAAKRSEQMKGKDVPPKRLAPPVSETEDSGRRAEQPQKKDMPGKPNEKEQGDKQKTDSQTGKSTEPNAMPKKRDTPRPDPQDQPNRNNKPEQKPDGKGDDINPTPDLPNRPEPNPGKMPKTKQKEAPPERRETAPTKQPKSEQEPRTKTEPSPERRPQSPPKRQPEPPREAKPEKSPDTNPESVPPPKPTREPSEKSSGKKESGKDPSDLEKRKRDK